MAKLGFFTDEDVHGAVAGRLRSRGFDAVSAPEAGRLGADDEAQLEWAALQGRILISFNVVDFSRIHADWSSSSRHHCGIILSRQRPIGDLIRRITAMAATIDAESMIDRLVFLTSR